MAEHRVLSDLATKAGTSTAKTAEACGISPSRSPARALGREHELRFLDRRMPAAQWVRFPMNQIKNEENRSDS